MHTKRGGGARVDDEPFFDKLSDWRFINQDGENVNARMFKRTDIPYIQG